MPPEERFKFPRVVAARNGDVNDGKAHALVRLINELIPRARPGPQVAAVVQFYGDEGLQRFRVAEQEVNMFLADFSEGPEITGRCEQNIRQAHFHQDVGAWFRHQAQ